jgi:beta-xylosidase
MGEAVWQATAPAAPAAPRRSARVVWWALVGLPVFLVAFVLSSSAKTSDAGEAAPTTPKIGLAEQVDSSDVADPFILRVATTYYRFGTTDWRSNVPTATSTDLVHWFASPDSFPVLPSWASPSISMTWAPAVLAVGGRYLLYVTTEEASSGRQCISLATSAAPSGPYVDGSKRPFLCQAGLGGSIDPSVVRDGGGQLHMVWKNDGNCCGLPTHIWEQDLSADGLHLVGAAHVLLSADEAWQAGNVEAPGLTPAPGHGWWLFYSGGSWRTNDYATGLAFCPTLRGSCHEVLDHPFLSSTPALRTPGGLDTFQTSTGETWVAFTTTVPIPAGVTLAATT